MEDETPSNWALEFEGKSASEIPDVPPPGLPGSALLRWKLAQQAAKQAARARERAAEPRTVAAPADNVEGDNIEGNDVEDDARPRIAMQPLIENLRERILRAQANLTAPAPAATVAATVPAQQPLARPPGDAAQLLEHQLASCAALLVHLTEFVASNGAYDNTCISFMDNMTSLMGASARIGKVVGRLRGQVSESRQTITVEKKATGGRGEGVFES